MAVMKLWFDSGETLLEVRHFSVQEAMSKPFTVKLRAGSPKPDVDLDAIVGRPMKLSITCQDEAGAAAGEDELETDSDGNHVLHKLPGHVRRPLSFTRTWTGICNFIERVAAVPADGGVTAESTYELCLVPLLWLLSQNRNYRIFQHVSVVEIARRILDQWSVKAIFAVDVEIYPKLELRMQYGESDLAFLSRLLEEAGISYHFVQVQGVSTMLLSDRPEAGERRAPIWFDASPTLSQSSNLELVTDVRSSREVRPRNVTLRDFDFRNPEFPLFASTMEASGDSTFNTPRLPRLMDDTASPQLPGAAGGTNGGDVSGGAQLADGGYRLAVMPSQPTGVVMGGYSPAVMPSQPTGVVMGGYSPAVMPSRQPGAGGGQPTKLASLPGVVLEQYHYTPGAFLIDTKEAGGGTPAADDKSVARHVKAVGRSLASRMAQAQAVRERRVTFKSNVLSLRAGMVFSIDNHPGPDLEEQPLLAVELSVEGTPHAWTVSGVALFARYPYVPLLETPRPQIHGTQTAIVVGPPGEEVYTDEFGRSRVQFPWDREGSYNDNSSCWVRVNYPTAGSGYGMVVLAQIGQEVLVSFLDGNPDQPMIVGRVYNATHPVPCKLPDEKLTCSWRSHPRTPKTPQLGEGKEASGGGGGGGGGGPPPGEGAPTPPTPCPAPQANEVLAENGPGGQCLYLFGVENYVLQVNMDAREDIGQNKWCTVGNNLYDHVGRSYFRTVKAHVYDTIEKNRETRIYMNDDTFVGKKLMLGISASKTAPPKTWIEMIEGRIVLVTDDGDCKVILNHDSCTVLAKGRINLRADKDITIASKSDINLKAEGDVVVNGKVIHLN